MARSLRTDRWVPLHLGADADYREKQIVDRWHRHRDAWLNVSFLSFNLLQVDSKGQADCRDGMG